MVRLMVSVELALVNAQAKAGIVPTQAAEYLEINLQKVSVDIEGLKGAIPLTGNAAAPLVKQLVAAVRKDNVEAAGYIHLGATSQDIVDTATVLKAKQFFNWLFDRLAELEVSLVKLTKEHRSTVMAGRTLMQHARPIIFGLKTAGWLQGIRSAKAYLKGVEDQLLCIQLGGAVGSRNKYISKEVKQSFAEILGLRDVASWHTQRTNIASFASALGVLCGSIAKIATDVVLLSQTEIGEVFESASLGRGTSSTMPHKRNPVLSSSILANTHRVPFLVAGILASMPQSHERSAGLWHAEWESLDNIICLSAGSVVQVVELIGGLEVQVDRMRQNIGLTQGLVFAETVALALAETQGKQTAHDTIKVACEKASSTGQALRSVLEEMDLGFSAKDYDTFFDPDQAIGASLEIIDDILTAQ